MDSAVIKDNKKEPIAIVGLSFRLPGDLNTIDEFWQALKSEHDHIQVIDNERWTTKNHFHPRKKEPGKSYSFAAGMISDIDKFDAKFFNISPREARQMDPRQRILLESTWEALEQGGIKPASLHGSDCGVYIGISGNEYSQDFVNDPATMEPHTMTGNACSIASNRISYAFGLNGPSMSIDTACSSALVSLHLACQAIWNNEIPYAIAGCASAHLHPLAFVGFSKASMLSEEGHCKPFDEQCDGYVRSEGVVVFFIKPLSQAEKDGDLIQAVIKNTGVNSDGQTSSLPVPSMEAQAKLLQRVHDDVGVAADDIAYIEAHGTGTPVGDPIEAHALSKALGAHRTKPLPIGSVKSNLGHLEVASGMAGMVKVIASLKNRALAATLHYKKSNPNIDLKQLNLDVVTDYTELDKGEQPIYMGVNCFGFGGTNAHILMSDYPKQEDTQPCTLLPPLFLSAKEPTALKNMASLYQSFLNQDNYYGTAYNLAYKRQKLDYGLAITGNSLDEILKKLQDFSTGKNISSVTGRHYEEQQSICFVYAGNGSQWQGMALELYQQSMIFRRCFDEVATLFSAWSDNDLHLALNDSQASSSLDLTEIAQPLLFAIQVGLTTLLAEKGIRPDFSLGHSVGEVAAAWASGSLTLADAVKLIYCRSSVQSMTKGQGKMAVVALSETALNTVLDTENINLDIAGVNSQNSLTVAGLSSELLRLSDYCQQQSIYYQRLDLDYPFHSEFMLPLKETFFNAAGTIDSPFVTEKFISSVTGQADFAKRLDEHYWWDNIAKPVAFNAALTTAIDKGARIFIEISPHPIMGSYIKSALAQSQCQANIFSTLCQGESDVSRMDSLPLSLCIAGGKMDLRMWFPQPAAAMALPHYAWQKERFWHKPSNENHNFYRLPIVHPLLGTRRDSTIAIWSNHIDPVSLPWLTEHQVDGVIVMPAAAMIEMAFAVANEVFDGEKFEVSDFEVHLPMVFDDEISRLVYFELNERDKRFVIKSRLRLSDSPFTQHAVGKIKSARLYDSKTTSCVELSDFEKQVSGKEHYQLATKLGLDYGIRFQCVEQAYFSSNKLIATMRLPEALLNESSDYFIHPGLLDGCFQSVIASMKDEILSNDNSEVYLPFRTESIRLLNASLTARYCLLELISASKRGFLFNVKLVDNHGTSIVEMIGSRLRAMKRSINVQPYNYIDSVATLKLDMAGQPFMNIEKLSDIQSLLLKEKQRESLHFDEALPLLSLLITRYVYEAIYSIFSGQNFTVEALDVCAGQAELLSWSLDLLTKNSLLIKSNDEYQFLPDPEPIYSGELWTALLGDLPAYISELLLIGRIGNAFSSLLCDQQVIKGTETTLAHLQSSAPCVATAHDLLLTSLETLLVDWPKARPLHVLQVGGSLLSDRIVDVLLKFSCSITISEKDGSGLKNIDNNYLGHENIHIIEHDWSTSFSKNERPPFDIVIVPAGLHNEKNIVACLNNIKQCLNPDGVLLFAERAPNVIDDFIFGCESTWWRYNNKDGAAGPLLTDKLWSQLLIDSGYVVCEPIFEGDQATSEGRYIIMAQALNVMKSTLPPESADAVALVDNPDDARALMEAHTSLNIHCLIAGVDFDPQSKSSIELALKDKVIVNDVKQFIFALGLKKSTGGIGPISSQRQLTPLLYFSRLLNKYAQCHLTVLTLDGALVEGMTQYCPEQAATIGFTRVLMNELNALDIRIIDLQGGAILELAKPLQQLMVSPDFCDESEWILTDKSASAIRFIPAKATYSKHSKQEDVYLDFHSAGRLSALDWFALPATNVGDEQVAIRPMSAGLNFRDVMYTMRLIPEEALEGGYLGATLGMEYAGVVTEVGSKVTAFSIGDKVMGFAPNSFSSRVVVDEKMVSLKPAAWTYNEAATVPTAFFTAYYALKELARVRQGERILIHGAAGGVGIATIQLANYFGLEVFATAGNEDKRAFLKMMGVKYIYDSRSLAFSEQVLLDTDGQGVDVVLNSLSGDAIEASLKVLRPFGRFLELGKRDFYENNLLGLRPFRNNISYFGVDADQLMIERAELTSVLFSEMMALFEQGELRPLPHRSFSAKRIANAFRYMQKSEQIGKIVVDLHQVKQHRVEAPRKSKLSFSADASYLVTGGLSGLGLKTAEWLIEKGAKKIILCGRNTNLDDKAILLIDKLQEQGGEIVIRSMDVTDFNAVQAVITEFSDNLKGVFHSAVVFDDALLGDLTPERIDRVLAPKVQGSWHLHLATQSLALEHFVLFSSTTSVFGNPGQANYVAANTYMESLVYYRRGQGLAAQFMGFGAIDDVGFLSRNETVKTALARTTGTKAMTSLQATIELEKLLLTDTAGRWLLDLNLSKIKRLLPSLAQKKFQPLLELESSDSVNNKDDIQALLEGKSVTEVQDWVANILTQEVAQIVCVSSKLIDPSQSLNHLGMDSLMSVELARAVEQRFKIDLPIMSLSQGLSLQAIIVKVSKTLLGLDEDADLSQDEQAVMKMAAQHGDLDEMEKLNPGVVVNEINKKLATEGGII